MGYRTDEATGGIIPSETLIRFAEVDGCFIPRTGVSNARGLALLEWALAEAQRPEEPK